MRDSFIFYRSFYEAIKDLPRDIQGEVYTAIMEYGLNGITTENLKPVARSIFTLIKPVLEFGNKQYFNGLKGGRPKKEETQPKPTENPTETQPKPNRNPNKDVDKDKDVEKDSVSQKERVGFENFGTFNNVFLKAEQYRHLQETNSPDVLKAAINDLSCKLADCSVESSNHYATLVYWLQYRNRQGAGTQNKYQQIDDTVEKAKKMMGL